MIDPTISFIFHITILLFSVVIHEVSHGLMALRLGDETAKLAGRLTLNPIKHLDPLGSVIVPILVYISSGGSFLFGWAKPVPYNPLALHKDYKYGPLKVAIAGPASNLILALIFGLIIRFGSGLMPEVTTSLIAYIVLINLVLFVFNLIPIPPLDGSKILTLFLTPRQAMKLQSLGMGNILFLILIIFLISGIIWPIVGLLFSLITGMRFGGI